jgi:glutathione S-transferase
MEQVDLRSGAQLSAEYRQINPNCTVPALRTEDGTVLTENVAIATYVEALHPDPPLLGTTPLEKGLVSNWNARLEWEGLMAIAEVLRNTSPAMKDRAMTGPLNLEQIPALAERGAKRLPSIFDALNEALAEREHVAIDGFSLADITALVVVDFARWVKITPGEELVHLKRWHESVSARPSAAA